MNKNRRELRAAIRDRYLNEIRDLMRERGEDVLKISSNQISFPVVDEEGNEDFIKITISVPTGERAGEEFDGYSEAADYKLHLEEKARKKAKR